MRGTSPRTYNPRRPLKIAVTAFVCVLLAAVILFTALFFGLKKYIAYDESDRLYLNIPWLNEEMHGPDGQNE